MSWKYEQLTGKMLNDAGEVIGIGYSGAGNGKNNPEFQDVHNVGPIPQGLYVIGVPHNSQTHGPFVMSLIPDPKTVLFGRDAFLIHGDSVHAPGTASQGCIIMSRDVRNQIWNSLDHILEVVSGEPKEEEV